MRATERDELSFKLNGAKLPAHLLGTINHTYQLSSPRFRSHPSYWYIFRLDRDHWPVPGDNAIEVTLHERDPEATPPLWVRDVELEIRYLRDKGAYRGAHNTDPDLGPYEHAVS